MSLCYWIARSPFSSDLIWWKAPLSVPLCNRLFVVILEILKLFSTSVVAKISLFSNNTVSSSLFSRMSNRLDMSMTDSILWDVMVRFSFDKICFDGFCFTDVISVRRGGVCLPVLGERSCFPCCWAAGVVLCSAASALLMLSCFFHFVRRFWNHIFTYKNQYSFNDHYNDLYNLHQQTFFYDIGYHILLQFWHTFCIQFYSTFYKYIILSISIYIISWIYYFHIRYHNS